MLVSSNEITTRCNNKAQSSSSSGIAGKGRLSNEAESSHLSRDTARCWGFSRRIKLPSLSVDISIAANISDTAQWLSPGPESRCKRNAVCKPGPVKAV